ncbi:sigma-70 family RNA polymerase sigma factor [Streptomyces sp. NPDC017993]|uniref:sigma-70 family RNA polymerase sigma factor n=1 Tax=Streptomyces sp. NPDC017993 TaxID=3365027 RepID=UPI0037A7160F
MLRVDHLVEVAADTGLRSSREIQRLDLDARKPHLAKLDERQRTLIELRFGAQMTQSEIGKDMGLSQMHISRLLARVLATLREGVFAEA